MCYFFSRANARGEKLNKTSLFLWVGYGNQGENWCWSFIQIPEITFWHFQNGFTLIFPYGWNKNKGKKLNISPQLEFPLFFKNIYKWHIICETTLYVTKWHVSCIKNIYYFNSTKMTHIINKKYTLFTSKPK